MKKMLAMLILAASAALPAGALARESGAENHPDYSMPFRAPAVDTPYGSQNGLTDQGTMAGSGQNPTKINWIHGDRD